MKLKNLGIYGIGFLACFGFGFSWPNLRKLEAPDLGALQKLVTGKKGGGEKADQVFSQNFAKIIADYEKPILAKELRYAGMEGMVSSLGDPHTIYLPPRAAKEFSDDTKANYAGIGARLSPDPLGAKVAVVFEDGPAYAGGLRAGDVITAVDGKAVGGQEVEAIVDRIKGQEGTSVALTVIRPKAEKPLPLRIKRARIVLPTVESKIIPGTSIGYVTVTQFSEPTAAQFDRELSKLEQQNVKGVVIDLRENPGGLLDIVTDMLGRFFNDKVVVTMKFRQGRGQQVQRTDSGGVHDPGYPISILMNEDTASAAEIFAGCMRDYGRAKLVGTHSYGKASVQNVFPLSDTASAKVTIAKYFLPHGSDIGRKVDEFGAFVTGGLQPDVPVELDLDVEALGDLKTDNQLQKAIETVKEQLR